MVYLNLVGGSLSKLIKLIKDVAEHKQVILSSGMMSDIYYDCKQITLDSYGLSITIPDLFLKMYNIAPFDAVGGLEMGAVPIVSAMVYYAAIHDISLKGFVVRKTVKEHGTQKFIEGPVKSGMRIAIVEDVVTTGKSAVFALEKAKEFGMIPVVIGAIIDREEGDKKAFDGVPFTCLLNRSHLC